MNNAKEKQKENIKSLKLIIEQKEQTIQELKQLVEEIKDI